MSESESDGQVRLCWPPFNLLRRRAGGGERLGDNPVVVRGVGTRMTPTCAMGTGNGSARNTVEPSWGSEPSRLLVPVPRNNKGLVMVHQRLAKAHDSPNVVGAMRRRVLQVHRSDDEASFQRHIQVYEDGMMGNELSALYTCQTCA